LGEVEREAAARRPARPVPLTLRASMRRDLPSIGAGVVR